MSVTNLGSGKVGLTNFSCSNISWYAPSVGAGQPLISLVPGRITPATRSARSPWTCKMGSPVPRGV
jgi:hypothetical protein